MCKKNTATSGDRRGMRSRRLNEVRRAVVASLSQAPLQELRIARLPTHAAVVNELKVILLCYTPLLPRLRKMRVAPMVQTRPLPLALSAPLTLSISNRLLTVLVL